MPISNLKMVDVPGHTLTYRSIQWLIEQGLITEANLASLTTVAGLVAACNAVALPEVSKQGRIRALTYIQDNGSTYLTDANVNTVGAASNGTRIATLRGIFTARDTDLNANTPPGLEE